MEAVLVSPSGNILYGSLAPVQLSGPVLILKRNVIMD